MKCELDNNNLLCYTKGTIYSLLAGVECRKPTYRKKVGFLLQRLVKVFSIPFKKCSKIVTATPKIVLSQQFPALSDPLTTGDFL